MEHMFNKWLLLLKVFYWYLNELNFGVGITSTKKCKGIWERKKRHWVLGKQFSWQIQLITLPGKFSLISDSYIVEKESCLPLTSTHMLWSTRIHTPQNTCVILFKARKKLTYFINTLTYVIYHGKSINKKRFGDFSVTFLKTTNRVKGYSHWRPSTVITLGRWWRIQLILIHIYSSGLSVW